MTLNTSNLLYGVIYMYFYHYQTFFESHWITIVLCNGASIIGNLLEFDFCEGYVGQVVSWLAGGWLRWLFSVPLSSSLCNQNMWAVFVLLLVQGAISTSQVVDTLFGIFLFAFHFTDSIKSIIDGRMYTVISKYSYTNISPVFFYCYLCSTCIFECVLQKSV